MSPPTRRAFLGITQNAIAAAAVGAISVRLIDAAEAMPIAPNPAAAEKPSNLVTQAQWGPGPGWGPPPPRPRRRRWVCWWHRGRRHCGWRWF